MKTEHNDFGWISVKDRLPNDEKSVLVLIKEVEKYGIYKEKTDVCHWIFIGWHIDGEWATTYCNGYKLIADENKETSNITYVVTHWMPLPELPKGRNKMKRIYISGPITGTDDFYERFAEAEAMWSCDELSVVNPAKLNDIMPKDATYDEYMKMSFELLGMCDAIYMLKGWEESKGANREYGYAVAKGMRLMLAR